MTNVYCTVSVMLPVYSCMNRRDTKIGEQVVDFGTSNL